MDLRSGELRKGGLRVRLQRQPFKVLAYLASRPGAVVNRETLRLSLWGSETFVDFDQGLNFCVKQIRAALGDLAQSPRFVETLPRIGYRFLAPVARAAAVAEAEPGPAAAAPRTQPASPHSVGVLPFADLSPEKDQDYFCEGVAEEILTALRRVDGLRVASRAACFRHKPGSADPCEIGRQLGVGSLLDGSVRKSGDRLRITVELIDTSDGFRIWAERFDRELQDVFAIQDEIAACVVQALEVTLGSAVRKAATTDLRAYELYLRGRKHYYEYGRRGMQLARELFVRALEVDPTFARAHAGLADCHAYLFTNGGRDPSHLEGADAASRRALELDPGLPEGHASRAVALSIAGHPVEAEQEFETATRLDRGRFEVHYFRAREAFTQGQPERAVCYYEEAMRALPDHFQPPLLVAQIYADLGRPAEAEAARRRGVQAVEAHLARNPDDVRALYMGANGLVALGDRCRGLEWADRALALEPGDGMLLYNVGCIRSLAGDSDGAIRCLEQAVEAGLAVKGWFDNDSNLDPLRGLPRFQALHQRLS
jgi:TolB-like protein